jgi:hypothetical protein
VPGGVVAGRQQDAEVVQSAASFTVTKRRFADSSPPSPKDWNELIHRHAHPGMAVFAFPTYQMPHVVDVHDVQWLLHHRTHDGQPIRPG